MNIDHDIQYFFKIRGKYRGESRLNLDFGKERADWIYETRYSITNEAQAHLRAVFASLSAIFKLVVDKIILNSVMCEIYIMAQMNFLQQTSALHTHRFN